MSTWVPAAGGKKNEVRVQDVEDVDLGSGGLGFRGLGSRFQVFSRPQAQGLGLRSITTDKGFKGAHVLKRLYTMPPSEP